MNNLNFEQVRLTDFGVLTHEQEADARFVGYIMGEIENYTENTGNAFLSLSDVWKIISQCRFANPERIIDENKLTTVRQIIDRVSRYRYESQKYSES